LQEGLPALRICGAPYDGAGGPRAAHQAPQTPRACCRLVAAMEQLQRDKAAAVAAVGRLEAELADARREREAARGAAAAAEARLADIDRLKREKAAALAAVQRLEVDAAAARSQARPAACRQARCGPQCLRVRSAPASC